jgi:hypothetical protein
MPNDEPRRDPPPLTDPLAEARWAQVRGDEDGIRNGGTTETRLDRKAATGEGSPQAGEEGGSGITGGMGDPGGER